MDESASFDITAEVSGEEFKRQASRFRRWVSTAPDAEFPVEAGRYHLYVSLACPWCHRVAVLRELTGLQDAVGISYVHPFRDARGWAFGGETFTDGPGGVYEDMVNGWSYMSEGYEATEPGFSGRVTVPVLWDRVRGEIVSNESEDIIRMFDSATSLGALTQRDSVLYRPDARATIDPLNQRIYDTINNGVYAAGFSRGQHAYDFAVRRLFDSLQWLEALLSTRRYVAGDAITEADWRLFPTLVRFDEVYHVHFRCNERRIVEYPALWDYTRELYQWPGVAQTVAMDQIKRHYYTTHDELNPKRIIPIGPAPPFTLAHTRGRVTTSA